MKKIVILALWFGKLPVYFPLWTRSLKINEDYEFLLFTDQKVDITLPHNLKVINLTLDQFKELIFISLSITPNFKHSYKICDFRPSFGELFANYITGYEFWGYCDIDLMFGNLSSFITFDVLKTNKKIFNRGHLTLYRNEPEINQLYRSSKFIDHKEILESSNSFLFDEWHGIHQIFKEFEIGQYHKECIADILPNAVRLTSSNIKNYKKQLFIWENGLVKQYFLLDDQLHSKELAYIHFQKRKITIPDIKAFSSTSIILSGLSFLPFEGKVTHQLIHKYDQANYLHYFQRCFNAALKKLSLSFKPGISISKSLTRRPIKA